MIAVFTNRGARLKSWRLKHYRDQKGEPLELVAGELGSAQPLPFSLRVPDEAATRTLNSALYRSQERAPPSQPRCASAPLIFEYRDSAGLQAIKEFRFDPAPYVLTFRAAVKVGDRPVAPVIEWGPAVSASSREAGTSARQAGGVIYQNGKLLRIAPADLAKQSVYEGDLGYAGVDDHYFVTMAISPGPSKVTFQPVAIPRPPPDRERAAAAQLMAWADRAGMPTLRSSSYVGPKDLVRLQAIDPALGKVIDFGWFDFIVVPLLQSAQLDSWLRRQLRLVDHHSHGSHQRGHVSAAAQERRLDAQDAGDPAGGQGDPGTVRQAEIDRSRASRR